MNREQALELVNNGINNIKTQKEQTKERLKSILDSSSEEEKQRAVEICPELAKYL